MDTEVECDKIYSELEAWFEMLKNAYESKAITEDEGRNLAELSRMILNYLTRKLPHSIAERMVNTVGGKVLKLQQDHWFEDGQKVGEKTGEARMAKLIKAITPGSEDYETALDGTEEERMKLYEKYGILS